MNANANTEPVSDPHERPSRAIAAALWTSAAILVALVLVQVGRLAPGADARADVTQVAGLTIITALSGDDEEVLCVLDSRAERLLVYGVTNRNQIDLFQALEVATLFAEARAAAAGSNRPRR